MAGKKIYGEKKKQISLSLTKTAVKWLEAKQAQLTARSLSDVIERMAREQSEALDLSSDEQNQTLVLNQEDSEALVKALLNPPSSIKLTLNKEDSEALAKVLLNPPLPNEALRAAALKYKQIISA
jgi:uncharacterized protein (DUF1778 family)